jgi:hypothetical protein
MEVVTKDTLLTHMYSSGLLNDLQHGFLGKKIDYYTLTLMVPDCKLALMSKKAADII